MKKRIWVVIVLVIFIALICFLSNGINVKENNNIKITTSFYPVYIATLNITDGVSGIDVINLTKDVNGCLHDYTLTTEELMDINGSDLLIINGAGMENFMDKIIANYPNLKVADASVGIDIIEGEDEVNSHTFASISNHIKQVENIANEIIQIDPVNKELYEKNKDAYISKLNNLKQEMKDEIKDFKYKNIVTFHESFEYFAKEFDLNVIATIETDHNTSPSAKDIKSVIDKMNKNNVKAIFVEPDKDKKIANTICLETSATVYDLNPVVSGKNDKDEYINIMKQNLEVLKEALK